MGLVEEDELLDIVDEDDSVAGSGSRKEIHQRGFCHRSVHVFLLDGEGRIYLQRRALTKREHPGKWDSSASGHVLSGEGYEAAAARELLEELGIRVEVAPILKVPACRQTGWEHSMLYAAGHAAGQCEPVPDPQEILEGRFFTEGEILELFRSAPGEVSPSFRLLFDAFRARLASGLFGYSAG